VARSPVLQIANAAQLRLLWSVNSALAINVLGASHTGSVVFNQALADTLGAAIKAAFVTNLAPLCTASVALARVGIRSLSSPHLTEFRDTGALALGTAVGDSLPAGVALCITLRTAESGKIARGRCYLPGFAESQNDSLGTTSAATATAAVAFVTAVRSALTASNLTLAVLSRPAYEQRLERTTLVPGQPDVVDLLSHTTPKSGSFRNVTSVESRNNRWEFQRRRDNGRGVAPTLLEPVAIHHF
jgi:hypothetical protein